MYVGFADKEENALKSVIVLQIQIWGVMKVAELNDFNAAFFVDVALK